MSRRRVNQRLCAVDGCGTCVFCRGWCSKHYSRWQLHGDVLDWRDRFIAEHPCKDRIGYFPLTKGLCAIVDEKWYDHLMQWKWCAVPGGYAIRKKPGTKNFLHMHRVVNNTPDGMDTDHINGNRLDNRESNLRSCTRSENNWNGRKKGTAKYKGLTRANDGKRWMARITHNWESIHIGIYNTQEEAALAYNKKAIELFGDFAKLNVIP